MSKITIIKTLSGERAASGGAANPKTNNQPPLPVRAGDWGGL